MVKANKTSYIQIFAWLLSLAVISTAFIAWGRDANWHILSTGTYLLFPLFGLLAFSTLWSQYIVVATREFFNVDRTALSNYFKVTGYLVLLFILLHPGLFAWQLWRDGKGLPPGSELHYVLPSLRGVVILGMINLTILLLFELRRVFAKKSWWRYMTYLVDLVMLSIFYHSLRLGTLLQHGWLRAVWLFYGATLVMALGYIYSKRLSAQK